VDELPRPLAAQLEYEEDDVAVTRPRSRSPSCIVDAETAIPLERFREPQLIIEAVMRRSLETSAGPYELLENTYPVIERLITGRLLVPRESMDSAEIVPSLRPNEHRSGFTVVRSIQVLEGHGPLSRRSRTGQPMAMKVLRSEGDAIKCAILSPPPHSTPRASATSPYSDPHREHRLTGR
jgi:hypothetical protein